MKKSDKIAAEFNGLIKRVILLKDSVHGKDNWNKNFLPKTVEGCKQFIKYCYDNYDIIG